MFGSQQRRKSLLEEIDAHIEIETQQNIDAGMQPEAARQEARKKFGDVLGAVEQSHDVWGWLWLENLLRDIRYAAHSLSTVPVYTAALVCTLALGLGFVTAMLAIVQSVLVLPVNLPHPGRLVTLYAEDGPERSSGSDHAASSEAHALSYQAIDALRRETHSFDGVSGYNTTVLPVQADGEVRVDPVMEVTPGFFQTLGIAARFGRLIGPDDGKSQVVVVSERFWRERLRGDTKAVGMTITILGRTWTVAGVLPTGFDAPGMTGAPVVFLPLSTGPTGQDLFKMESGAVIARLRSGVSEQQAREEAQSVFAHSGHTHLEQQRRLGMRSYTELIAGTMQNPLLALLGAAVVLLLIASANAANLQIGRSASRLPEMSVRSALGAGFGRLMQQLVTENILVSLLGAALGSGLAVAVVSAMRHAYAGRYPRFDELTIHPLVLCTVCVLAVTLGVLASVVPAVQIRRNTAAGWLSARIATRRSRLPGLLVAAQVALTCVLLVVAGLFVRTLQSLENVELGIDPRGITTLVLMPEDQQQDPQLSRNIETLLLRKFQGLPGVQSVTMQSEIPFSSYNVRLHGTTEVAGRPYRDGDGADYSLVSTDFVKSSGIQLRNGRGFLPEDESSGTIVVLVNEAFRKIYLGDRRPIGSVLRFHREPGETEADIPFPEPMTVVGVVQNEIQGGDLSAPYQPMVYLDEAALPRTSPLSEVFSISAQYAVRSTLPNATVAAELRAVLRQNAPTMVEMSLVPMQKQISRSLGQRREALRLVAGFGIVAMILSAVGIYGVLAYSVAMRRREIGIRMALGSTRRKVAGLVASQAGRMVLAGIALGVAGAWVAGRAVQSFLFGVKALDAATILATTAVLLAVSAVAACIPAMRAARVDPVETLRT